MGMTRQRERLRELAVWICESSGLALWRARLKHDVGPDAVFLWIPKTAGTSLYEVLGSPPLLKTVRKVRSRFANRGLVTFGHIDYAQLVHSGYVSRDFDQAAFKFCFTRDPYDRVVSLYAYSQRVERLPRNVPFLEFCRRLHAQRCEPIGLYNSVGLSQCNSQVRWIENTKLDFIGRFESLREDVPSLLDALGVAHASMPHRNATLRRDYQSYYCEESRQLVDDLFDEDFRVLGYEKRDFKVARRAA